MITFNSFRFVLLFILGILILTRCTDNKNKIIEKTLLTEDSTMVVPAINKEQAIVKKESTVSTYRDPRKPHLDSIKKWNAELITEKEKFKIKADAETQTFSIDTKTGEVIGCPLLAFKGISDDKYWSDRKEKRKALRARFTKIKPKIRSNIMEDKKGELWYGDPKNTEIEGTPEAVHSGRGPVGFLYSNDGNHLIVPVGYPHGGMMDELFFFDSNGEFISKTTLDRPLNMSNVYFNPEQTFVTVSDGVNGDFYFFKTNGDLERKGNFNKLTGDAGTSYGKPSISNTGKFWILNNNLGYLFNSDSLVTKINGNNFFIDENRKLLHFFNAGKFMIIDIENSEIKYQLIQKNIRLLNINGKRIRLQNSLNKKKYNYEIL